MPRISKAQKAAEAQKATEAAAAAAAAESAADDSAAVKPSDEATDQAPNGDAEPARDIPADDAPRGVDLDALNTAEASAAAPAAADEIAAGGGVDTAATVVPPPEAPPPAVAYPQRVRVTNNTRMPVQVPALHLDLPAGPGHADVTLYSGGDFQTLHGDLSALFALNGFGEDAFTIAQIKALDA